MARNDDTTHTFIAIGPDGKPTTCVALFTFDSEDTGKSYIVYTDDSTDENGFTNAYASTYDPVKFDDRGEHSTIGLHPIETEEEWQLIEEILDEIQRSVAETGTVPADLFG